MRIQTLNPGEVLASLDSSARGLSKAEAQRRLAEFGPNRVEQIEKTPVAARLLHQFTHFFALILWFAAGLALVAEIYQPGGGWRRWRWPSSASS